MHLNATVGLYVLRRTKSIALQQLCHRRGLDAGAVVIAFVLNLHSVSIIVANVTPSKGLMFNLIIMKGKTNLFFPAAYAQLWLC